MSLLEFSMNLVVRSFAFAAGAALLSGCSMLSQLDTPRIEGVQPHIVGLDAKGADLAFDVRVHNPYPVALQARRVTFRMDVEGQRLIDSQTAAAARVPAGATAVVKFPVRVEFAKAAAVARRLISANEMRYKLSGAAVMDAFGREVSLPFSHEGKLPILRPPKFSHVKMKFARSGFAAFRVDVDAQVTNPNVFEIDLSGLGYALELNGRRIGKLSVADAGALGPGQTKPFHLAGKLSAIGAAVELTRRGAHRKVRIIPSGHFKTPYGRVKP